ncbi:MAG: hypothetical protein GX117_12205, partial [Candidatus Hydrogenedentes bacterium]|nr:hypothetical protein [Candidatus Hydrogenedentota bacterium]
MIRRDSITIISSLLMMVVLALAALCADAAQYISTIEDLQKIVNDSAWP